MVKLFANYSNALMLLTSIHHLYGAYLYDTPWRLHVLAFSIPVIVLNWYTIKRFQGNKIVFYVFLLTNFTISISLIGMVEGGYNHLVKNVLFYIGTSPDVMTRLFPPPTYVMPNDFIFEFTGILQALILIPLLYYFVRLIQSQLIPKDNKPQH